MSDRQLVLSFFPGELAAAREARARVPPSAARCSSSARRCWASVSSASGRDRGALGERQRRRLEGSHLQALLGEHVVGFVVLARETVSEGELQRGVRPVEAPRGERPDRVLGVGAHLSQPVAAQLGTHERSPRVDRSAATAALRSIAPCASSQPSQRSVVAIRPL
jgi:hypothetical protein